MRIAKRLAESEGDGTVAEIFQSAPLNGAVWWTDFLNHLYATAMQHESFGSAVPQERAQDEISYAHPVRKYQSGFLHS
jgi:hypothetical protein